MKKRSIVYPFVALTLIATIVGCFACGVFAVAICILYTALIVGLVVVNVKLARKYPRFYRWLGRTMWLMLPH